MHLILKWQGVNPILEAQDGSKLTAVCSDCQAVWLNGIQLGGDQQCRHREVGVLPIYSKPEPVVAGEQLKVDTQDHNQVLHAVINKMAATLEAAGTPPEEMAKHVVTLQEIQKQLEVPHG